MTRFHYPYNFVRVDPNAKVDRQPPAGHARFLPDRLSGVLHVTLTPEGPLFVPDPTPVSGKKGAKDAGGHCTYRFARDEQGRPTLPATSLKGMVRALYEALTVSCFSVFPSGKEHVGFRYNPRRPSQRHIPPEFKPARVEKGDAGLVLVPCRLVEFQRDSFRGVEEGARVSFNFARTRQSRGRTVQCGEADRNGPETGYFKPSWRMQSVSDRPRGAHKHELVFVPDGAPIPIPPGAVKAYNRIIEAQQALVRSGDYDLRCGRGDDLHALRPDDLVYYRRSATEHGMELSRTGVPRVSADSAIRDLLPKDLHPCHQPDRLCPACRVWGMVNPEGHGAYRGHVTFGAVTWEPASTEPWQGAFTELRIQAGPHPESANLYLRPRQGDATQVVEYQGWRAGQPAGQLRGRKRYWVHGAPQPANWTMPEGHPYAGKEQSITAELLVLHAGKFSFEVRFDNLEPWELGALLFALELPWDGEPGRHQMGRGKPLGLGTCRLTVDRERSRTWSAKDRYGSLAAATATTQGDWDGCVANMKDRLGGSAEKFAELPHIRDLRALTVPRDAQVRYPDWSLAAVDAEIQRDFQEACEKARVGHYAPPGRPRLDRKAAYAKLVFRWFFEHRERGLCQAEVVTALLDGDET